jgi:hypothetical protein
MYPPAGQRAIYNNVKLRPGRIHRPPDVAEHQLRGRWHQRSTFHFTHIHITVLFFFLGEKSGGFLFFFFFFFLFFSFLVSVQYYTGQARAGTAKYNDKRNDKIKKIPTSLPWFYRITVCCLLYFSVRPDLTLSSAGGLCKSGRIFFFLHLLFVQ